MFASDESKESRRSLWILSKPCFDFAFIENLMTGGIYGEGLMDLATAFNGHTQQTLCVPRDWHSRGGIWCAPRQKYLVKSKSNCWRDGKHTSAHYQSSTPTGKLSSSELVTSSDSHPTMTFDEGLNKMEDIYPSLSRKMRQLGIFRRRCYKFCDKGSVANMCLVEDVALDAQ
jgi:hypothetical protein